MYTAVLNRSLKVGFYLFYSRAFRDVNPCPNGLGLECSGFGINHKTIRHGTIINNVILNCESALNSNISIAKYLSTIVIIIMLLQFF